MAYRPRRHTKKDNTLILLIFVGFGCSFCCIFGLITLKVGSTRVTNQPSPQPRAPVYRAPIQVEPDVIEIKKLKIHSGSGAHTTIDFEVFNKSDRFIESLYIDVLFYDLNNQYLGKGLFSISNLRPRESKVDGVILLDTKAVLIRDWKASISLVKPRGFELDQ